VGSRGAGRAGVLGACGVGPTRGVRGRLAGRIGRSRAGRLRGLGAASGLSRQRR
jgi:hypothetical protein